MARRIHWSLVREHELRHLIDVGFIVDATRATLRRGSRQTSIKQITIDSREHIGDACLFIALRGERFDGHDFLTHVASAGAVAALVERGARAPDELECVIEVDDALTALQSLAAAWRQRMPARVIGITGSNGKTIAKEMIAAMVSRRFATYRSPGSYNSQVGVALALLGIEPEHEVAIIEAGISAVGEMEKLQRMIDPDVGVITNIGLAHAAGLPTLDVTAREKMHLFDDITEERGWLVYSEDDPTLAEAASAWRGRALGVRVSNDVVRPRHALAAGGQPAYTIYYERAGDAWELAVGESVEDDEAPYRLSASAEHSVKNAAIAIAVASELGCESAEIRDGLAAFEVAPMRLEMHTTPDGITLINDAYNADPTSVRAALGVLMQQGGAQRKIAILGDMLDLGVLAHAEHANVGRFAADAGVDLLIGVGEFADALVDGALAAGMPPEQARACESLDALDPILDELLMTSDMILFKGSRALGLERVAERLLESVGPTRLTVDLEALRENYHATRRHLGAGVKVLAVVKSFGYGNDATRVSMALVREGVSALAVAYPDEAIPLRRMGLSLPILVNNTMIEEADKIVKYDLTGLVYSRRVAAALAARARAKGRVARVHIKVDTGMRRVGIEPERLPALLAWLKEQGSIEVTGVMTHLAGADEVRHDDFTNEQLARFERALAMVRATGIDPGVVHAANTAAAWRFERARHDMVRVGIGLYGVAPSAEVEADSDGLRLALRMSTRVIHIKWVDVGESVGYGRTWVAPRRSLIATIAAGYNDGFARYMSNGGEVLIAGRRCPVVGNVCMDASMIDVTNVADAVSVGDEVVIFGEQRGASIHPNELARRGGTISYEVLCNISPRVRRIFVG